MAQKNKKTGLTDREQLFVLEYMKDLNITQSAIRAWYSEKSACSIWTENLRKPHIQEAIAKQRDKYFQKSEVEGQYVIDNLKEITDIAMQRKPVKDFQKNDIGEVIEWEKYILDLTSAISANEKLWKYHKLFTDKVETTGKDGGAIEIKVEVNYEAMTPKEIQEAIKKEMWDI